MRQTHNAKHPKRAKNAKKAQKHLKILTNRLIRELRRLLSDELPINYEAAKVAEEMNLNIVTCALNGGEDYELLFTCDINDYEKLIPLDDIYIVGHITDKADGTLLIGRNGEQIPLKAQGWNAFTEKEQAK